MPTDHDCSSNQILALVTTLLTPLFLELTGSDLPRAYAAAAATINEYRARTGMEALLIAQIIAFGLAGVATVVQSQQPELPPETAMKLHTKANSLARTSDIARKTLDRARCQPLPQPIDHEREAKVLAVVAELATAHAAPPAPAATPASAQPAHANLSATADIWAEGFAKVAREIAASLPDLPADEHRLATSQLSALRNVARDLRDPPAQHPA